MVIAWAPGHIAAHGTQLASIHCWQPLKCVTDGRFAAVRAAGTMEDQGRDPLHSQAMSAKPRVKPKTAVGARVAPARATAASQSPAKPVAKSAAQGATIAGYIAKLEPWQATLVRSVCTAVEKAGPKLSSGIKWGQPVFEQGGPVCYVKAFRSAVNFGFWRGIELKDPKGVLEGSGEKMRHIKLSKGATLNEAAVSQLIKQAISLNQIKGDPTKPTAKAMSKAAAKSTPKPRGKSAPTATAKPATMSAGKARVS